ncbi:DUF3173 family protein, partial [Enterococcus faecium]|uniref:DUF3173 family protein n=1 Tax=Enterococcus faecium TaxID=1352 RepID=UPI0035D41E9E
MVITKNELMKLGYGKYQSERIIRQAKAIMVSKSYTYYENRRLGLVPVESVDGMATVFLTNFIRCRTSFRMLFRLSLTMSLLGCDDLRQELTVK